MQLLEHVEQREPDELGAQLDALDQAVGEADDRVDQDEAARDLLRGGVRMRVRARARVGVGG